MKNKSGSGFTLIEILVVVAIIAFIASFTMYAVNTARSKARNTKRMADTGQIMKGAELYYNSNGSYPIITTPSNTLTGIVPTFITTQPVSPEPADGSCTTAENRYTYQSNAVGFGVLFCMSSGPSGGGVYVRTQEGLFLRNDINHDGVFDANDPAHISQFVASMPGVTCNIAQCDISGNGAVTGFDASLLLSQL